MTVNYIYNTKGKPEYAVVPYILWEELEKLIDEKAASQVKKMKKIFEPSKYYGILKHLDLDINTEIKNMRKEWKRNIL